MGLQRVKTTEHTHTHTHTHNLDLSYHDHVSNYKNKRKMTLGPLEEWMVQDIYGRRVKEEITGGWERREEKTGCVERS